MPTDEFDKDQPLFRKLYPKAKRIIVDIPVLAWGGAKKSIKEKLAAWAKKNAERD